MNLDTWHVILIIVVIILLVWFFMGNKIEFFGQNSNQNMNGNRINQILPRAIKFTIDNIFYERLLMITYFTDKSNLNNVETRLVNDMRKISQLIISYCPKLSAISNFINKNLENNFQPYFNLIYNLYDSIESGDQAQQEIIIQKLNNISRNIAIYIDNLLGTTTIQQYTSEYMKFYIADIFAYVSGNQIKDMQYMQAMTNMGIDLTFYLIYNLPYSC